MPYNGSNGNTGKPGRSGRKSLARETALQSLLDELWTKTERIACLGQLIADSRSPDFKIRHESRKLLLAYAYGKPKERHDVSADNFAFDSEDMSLLNDYEIQRLISGDDPRSVFVSAKSRRIKEEVREASQTLHSRLVS
jgi:hypothetical protein